VEQDNLRRRQLSQERAVLIQNGTLSPRLRQVLTSIFVQYAGRKGAGADRPNTPDSTGCAVPTMSFVAATRLWYRCGWKLAHLQSILAARQRSYVSLDDFLDVIQRVVAEDEVVAATVAAAWATHTSSGGGAPSSGSPTGNQACDNNAQLMGVPCKEGDKVELAAGYEKFGDASGGPLQPGDRGVVIGTQIGPNGERYVRLCCASLTRVRQS